MTLLRHRTTLLCCALLLGWSVVHAPALANDPIRISTSDMPPFSMDRGNGRSGALFEMVEELSRRTGLPANIEFVPWKRAMFLSTSRPRSAIFPLTRSPDRENQYRWLAPLYRETFVFVSMKGSDFVIDHPERNKRQRIGILRGSLMIKFLHQQGYMNIIEAATIEEGVRFLRRGIVDAVCSDQEILRALLGGRIDGDYAASPTLRETSTWLGGSRDFSDADAARFEQAMKDMIEDGTYARLLKKYQVAHPQIK